VFKEIPSLGISRTCLKCHISGTRFIVRGAIQLTRATSSNLPIRPTIFVSCTTKAVCSVHLSPSETFRT